MSRYNLLDFNNILEATDLWPLSDETISIINSLVSQVGAPEYVKTPQFKKNTNMSQGIRRRRKTQELDDDDWDTIRMFQATEFEKKEGINKNIDVLRKYLNMITPNTYDKLKENIETELNNIISLNNNDDLITVANEIFKVITSNILYSDIYSKLYKDLISKYDIFMDILNENFCNLENVLNSIKYYNPEEDYNKFCENNKTNEERRALCAFYINLMKEDIIDKDEIINIILNIFSLLNSYINIKTKTNEIDELSEILHIMITNSYEKISVFNPELYKKIFDNVVTITNIKNKEKLGITNKCIFKHMDILDEIA